MHASGPLVPRRWARTYLSLEFLSLFVVVPIVLWFERHEFGRRIIPTLVVVGLFCGILLVADRSFDRRRLWNARELGSGLRKILRTLIPGAIVVGALTAWFEPQLWLRLPRTEPRLWLLILMAYPVLSVYPQEIIFRTFLFHRYRALLPSDRSRIAASALAFGAAHLFFANPLAPLLSGLGGWLFARTYARSGSTLQAGIEHGLWGDLLFTVGLGWYFYGGSIS